MLRRSIKSNNLLGLLEIPDHFIAHNRCVIPVII